MLSALKSISSILVVIQVPSLCSLWVLNKVFKCGCSNVEVQVSLWWDYHWLKMELGLADNKISMGIKVHKMKSRNVRYTDLMEWLKQAQGAKWPDPLHTSCDLRNASGCVCSLHLATCLIKGKQSKKHRYKVVSRENFNPTNLLTFWQKDVVEGCFSE